MVAQHSIHDNTWGLHPTVFGPGRTIVSQIPALRGLTGGDKQYRLLEVITFINSEKAFGTIHKGKMIKLLRAYMAYQLGLWELFPALTK